MKILAILGAGGHGKVVGDAAESSGEWQKIEFFDDNWKEIPSSSPWPLIGDTDDLISSLDRYDGIVVAIGDNTKRMAKCKRIMDSGGNLATIIHPAAVASRYATAGAGTVILAGAIVNIHAILGIGCIINTGAVIEHDCSLGMGVHVGTGTRLAGGVTVGDRCWIGIGSSVRQLVRLGNDVFVGAGAVVVGSIDDSLKVVGVPAKPMS